jgi:Trk K+ transport system NAD-binding subunit
MSASQADLFEIADGLCAAEVSVPEILVDQTLAEANIRSEYDITVLAIRRLDDVDPAAPRHLIIPKGDTIIRSDDRLLVFGTAEKIDEFSQA